MQFSLFNTQQANALDYKGAAIITLACALTALLSGWWPSIQAIWAPLTVPFILYAKIGNTPKDRGNSILLIGLVASVFILLTTWLNIGLAVLLPWLLISTFLLYAAPRYLGGTQLAGAFILFFIVLAENMPAHSASDVYARVLAVMAGTVIAFIINLLFDRGTHKSIPVDKSLYLLQRALRMAITIAFAVFICRYLKIQNSAWVAISLIVIEQNTLGATVKKALNRILGTVLGIIVGLLLAHYVFQPYPVSRMIALVILVYGMFATLRFNYPLTVFIGTILISNLFYILYGQQMTLLHFMLSRIGDTLLGITLGILSFSLIFPRSIFQEFREGMFNFWRSAAVFLRTAHYDSSDQNSLDNLQRLAKKVEGDITDFRYEPLSLLFRRYHLCVHLMRHMKKLARKLTGLAELKQQLSPEIFQSTLIQPIIEALTIIVDVYSDPYIKTAEPLQKADARILDSMQQLKHQEQAEKILNEVHCILDIYRKTLTVPRWRLELT